MLDMNTRLRAAAGVAPAEEATEVVERVEETRRYSSVDGGRHSAELSDPYRGTYSEPTSMNERLAAAVYGV